MKIRVSLCCFLLLVTIFGGSLSAQTATSTAKAAPQNSMDRDLLEVTIPQLEEMYRNHKYTVTEVVHWYMARIDRYNGIYRAVQNLDLAGALATAAQEDKDAAAGGSGFRARPAVGRADRDEGEHQHQRPDHHRRMEGLHDSRPRAVAPKDATIVAKLRAAGAIILGQTNMPDFAASDTNRSTAYGRTGNAYDVRFSPGGSSGGTVTAVTANMAVLGNGTDTGNSIRMPSATSAVVGVFPTRGLVSIAGIAPLDWLLDNTGPIARNVTDAAIALDVMAGEDPNRPAHDRLCCQGAARSVYAISEGRCAEGQTLRRARVHSFGSGNSVPGHSVVSDAGRGGNAERLTLCFRYGRRPARPL